MRTSSGSVVTRQGVMIFREQGGHATHCIQAVGSVFGTTSYACTHRRRDRRGPSSGRKLPNWTNNAHWCVSGLPPTGLSRPPLRTGAGRRIEIEYNIWRRVMFGLEVVFVAAWWEWMIVQARNHRQIRFQLNWSHRGQTILVTKTQNRIRRV